MLRQPWLEEEFLFQQKAFVFGLKGPPLEKENPSSKLRGLRGYVSSQEGNLHFNPFPCDFFRWSLRPSGNKIRGLTHRLKQQSMKVVWLFLRKKRVQAWKWVCTKTRNIFDLRKLIMMFLSLFAYMETKKQKDTAPKTLLGFLPNVEIVGNEQIPKHARAWTWNFTVLWDFSSFASKDAGRNPATWKNVNSLGKLPTLAGWKHPISETIHRKCQGLHVIFKKKQHHHHHHKKQQQKKEEKNPPPPQPYQPHQQLHVSVFGHMAPWHLHPGVTTASPIGRSRLHGTTSCMAFWGANFGGIKQYKEHCLGW